MEAAPRRRRIHLPRLRLYDYVLVILLVGMLVSGAGAWSAQREAADSNKVSASALKRVMAQNKCLTTFSNDLADALDRRTDDNQKLFDVDLLRDQRFDALIVNLLKQPPPANSVFRRLLVELNEANAAKVAAKKSLDTGRAEKSYPQAPRDACKNVD